MNKNPKIEKYLQSLSALSQSTDDYLFVWDMENDAVWFFGAIEEKFAIRQPNQTVVTPEQMMSIIYEKEYIILGGVDVPGPCIFSADNYNIRQQGL